MLGWSMALYGPNIAPPGGAAGHLCLALSASHPFLHFGEAVGFHTFFASYFVLHNSYIKILAIHRYKSFLRCSNNGKCVNIFLVEDIGISGFTL